ncbi:Glutathione transport system permease protein GsiC [Pandoraea horticolens]|uniref:Glutathione transport system permease protein GsiC n=1 Tax=Pandoraea horticolens TaxID=2508298 RepID=A0A5E4X9E1_9BURK|nr:ABC transporter permease [Pandoraea horticolens]VVE32979.1 Glutathione transport system permease protein GsiC [Pandoraea horticolens]
MSKFILKRVLGMLAVMFMVLTIVFVIVRVAPGDPAAVMLGPDATADDIAALRHELGLDRSILVQYVRFIGQVATGDFGNSIFLHQSALLSIAQRAEPTLLLTAFSLLIATLIALPLGMASAYWRGSWFDQLATTLSMLAASTPSFWLGLLLIQYLAVHHGWFPVSGYGGVGATFLERARHLLLPSIALGTACSAIITRFSRASLLDVLDEDYVRTARSKGMGEVRVVVVHALKNAMVPILTVIGLTATLLVSGAVVIETVFDLPGVGSLVVSAVLRRDYPVIQAALVVISGAYVLINFGIDMLYTVVDPRVRIR